MEQRKWWQFWRRSPSAREESSPGSIRDRIENGFGLRHVGNGWSYEGKVTDASLQLAEADAVFAVVKRLRERVQFDQMVLQTGTTLAVVCKTRPPMCLVTGLKDHAVAKLLDVIIDSAGARLVGEYRGAFLFDLPPHPEPRVPTTRAPETVVPPAPRSAPAVADPATAEQAVEAALGALESRLKAHPDKSLPVVSLRIREVLGSRRISWHFATGYGSNLDADGAKRVLSEALAPHGYRITGGGDSMSDRHGNRYHFWDYDIKQGEDPYEEQIKQFDALDRDPAVAKAQQLLANGQIELLVAWLRSGEYYGIPAEVLHTCDRDDAAAAIIALLADPNSDVRTRAATALGPLGGVEAAKALCAALPGATARQEYWRIAGALGRSAWPGAAPALTGAIRNPHDSSVRSSLAEALVRCGDVSYGLDILYAGLSDDAGSHDYASRLDRLDQDGIRDARLIPEITALLERTKSTNSKYIGREVIHRHQGE